VAGKGKGKTKSRSVSVLRAPFQAPPIDPAHVAAPPAAFALQGAEDSEAARIRAALLYGANFSAPARFVVPFIAHRKQW
jgi:hypothetical protein